MQCEDVREQLSARLDGEHDPAQQPSVDGHVAKCGECAAWWEQVQTVTRLARTAAALPIPALSQQALNSILDAAPSASASEERTSRTTMVANTLRIALLGVGLAQFFLGIAQIGNFAGVADAHTHTGGIPVSSGHLWHESAAWNVAIGAALAWLAWRRTRPASLLPVMTAFVAVLGLLTLNDVLAGRVEGSRVLTHSLLLAGYVLLLVMHHPKLRDGQPPVTRIRPVGSWGLGSDQHDEGGPSATVYPFPVRAQAAHHITAVSRKHAA